MSEEKRKQQLEWMSRNPIPKKDLLDPNLLKGKNGARSKKRIVTKIRHRIEEAVDEEMDLHGLTIDEAIAQVELWLEQFSHLPGARLRVVHGRSGHSRDTIRGRIYWCAKTVWKGKLKAYYQEPHNSGATILVLAANGKKKPVKG